ncbi:MAG: MBL fold metallo-hydrolase, partial [Candidatus Dadabacteria bacterium]
MLQTREVADGVTMLSFYPRAAINAYYCDGILFDAGIRGGRRALFHWLKNRPLTHHALTHAHPDHQGCSAPVRERFAVPVLIG